MNRKERRRIFKKFGIKQLGVQDDSKATMEVYWIPIKRYSRAGVEHIYYKKVVDKVGLKK